MAQPDGNNLKHYLGLILLCLVLYLPGLTTLPPVDRDEARFVQATRQMLESKDGNQADQGRYWSFDQDADALSSPKEYGHPPANSLATSSPNIQVCQRPLRRHHCGEKGCVCGGLMRFHHQKKRTRRENCGQQSGGLIKEVLAKSKCEQHRR